MTTRYNETRTATRKENKIKSLFYSIRDLWLRETAGAKLYRRWRWRNSWNPWRNVRSSITESVLEDFSHSFLFSYFFRSRNILIAAEFNTRESYAPGYWNSTVFLATVQLRAARRHDHDRQRLSLRFRTLRLCCGNSLGLLLWFWFTMRGQRGEE